MAKEIITTPEVEKIKSELPVVIDNANAIVISDDNGVRDANAFITTLRSQYKQLEAAKKAMIDPVNGFFRPLIKQLKDAESIVSDAVKAYGLEQRKIAQQKQREAEALASKEAERKRKALESRAKKWEAKGSAEKAEELREEAATVQSLAVTVDEPPSSIKAADGHRTTFSDGIEVHVVDKESFVRAVVSGDCPVWDAIEVKAGPVKKYIELTNRRDIPGIFVKDTVIVRQYGGKDDKV